VTAPAPPEARQCQQQGDPNFGCVAVKAAVPGWAWGVFNPATGGHWEQTDATVSNWAVIHS
jgi:hypothetical protein